MLLELEAWVVPRLTDETNEPRTLCITTKIQLYNTVFNNDNMFLFIYYKNIVHGVQRKKYTKKHKPML